MFGELLVREWASNFLFSACNDFVNLGIKVEVPVYDNLSISACRKLHEKFRSMCANIRMRKKKKP